ncbi:MAG: hypothetical protein ABSF22_27005 [Bryobacteraceae bacterium]
MRCLHCNKKLSLLKLAKGDSFCSSEHFDAHQLQLSKDAIARLMNASAEDVPKPALVITPREDVPVLEEARPEEVKEVVPPYASFARSPLSCTPAPPAPEVERPDHGELAASPQDLAYPVHELEATACLLNLYARLSLAGTMPLNWTSPRNFILAAENFPTEFIRPSLIVSPDFSELSAPVEELPEKPAASKIVAPTTSRRLPFLIAPSFGERSAAAASLDAAGPQAGRLGPILERDRPPFDAHGTIARPTRFFEAASLQAQNSTAHWIESTPERAVSGSLVAPAAIGKTEHDGWHVSSRLIGLTSRILDTTRQPPRPVDFAPPAAASLLAAPEAEAVRHRGSGQILTGQPRVFRAVPPVSGNFLPASDLPRSEPPSGTAPIAPVAHEPGLRAVKIASLFTSAVETRPLGQEIVFFDRTVPAMEYGLRSILAKFPPAEPFSTTASRQWHSQAPHFALPAAVVEGPAWPSFPLQLWSYELACRQPEPAAVKAPWLSKWTCRPVAWPVIDAAARRDEPAAPAAALPALRFSEAQSTATKVELLVSGALPVALERPFIPASGCISAQTDLRYLTAASFPAANAPAGNPAVNWCEPVINWELRAAASPSAPAVKFLPLREDPTLPAAINWARLRSLHR